MSCLGRERVLEHAAATWGTRSVLLRLNYAVDLRYGVLVDVAQRVLHGAAVDVTMGFVNCIWQGDASACAVWALSQASSPPLALNLTGPEILRVRDVAESFGRRFDRSVEITGLESADALLSNTNRLAATYGSPRVAAPELIDWVAGWLSSGGVTSGKATRFEQREGAF